jgi:6-phosphogluconolactonase
MDPQILTFDTPLAAAEACGDRTLGILDKARKERGIGTVAVSGGSTPRLMFRHMAQSGFDWTNIHIFQVDERCVPPDHQVSNFRMTKESLLDAIKIDPGQIHRIKGELAREEAAQLYIQDLVSTFRLAPGELPVFDVMQRGMGPDSHTASLFPGEPLIGDRTGIAAAVDVDKPYIDKVMRYRVTLLPGVLECARHTLCLATGADKADALYKVLRGSRDPFQWPSQISSPDMAWYIDKAASAQLDKAASAR